MKGAVSGGGGNWTCASTGGVSNNNGASSSSSSSSSTSARAGVGRTAVPMDVAKAGRFARFLFFRLGFGRTRTLGILDRY